MCAKRLQQAVLAFAGPATITLIAWLVAGVHRKPEDGKSVAILVKSRRV